VGSGDVEDEDSIIMVDLIIFLIGGPYQGGSYYRHIIMVDIIITRQYSYNTVRAVEMIP
jgi:hypothetical protein